MSVSYQARLVHVWYQVKPIQGQVCNSLQTCISMQVDVAVKGRVRCRSVGTDWCQGLHVHVKIFWHANSSDAGKEVLSVCKAQDQPEGSMLSRSSNLYCAFLNMYPDIIIVYISWAKSSPLAEMLTSKNSGTRVPRMFVMVWRIASTTCVITFDAVSPPSNCC